MSRFIKISTDGQHLPEDAPEWVAVLDVKTNLYWTVAEIKKGLPWRKAQAVPATLDTAGFTDWRMPTVEELFLLADRTRTEPAIDTAFFPDCKSDWYWSSTPYCESPGGCAWCVGFRNGDSSWDARDGGGFVRAVRPGQ